MGKARAELIARTEISTLRGEARLNAWEQSVLVTGKKWAISGNPCSFCEALYNLLGGDDQKPTPLRKNFLSLGDKLYDKSGKIMKIDYRNISAAPLHPNCRCGTIEILLDEPEGFLYE